MGLPDRIASWFFYGCITLPFSLPVLAGGAVVLLAIAAGAGWYFMKKKKGGNQ